MKKVLEKSFRVLLILAVVLSCLSVTRVFAASEESAVPLSIKEATYTKSGSGIITATFLSETKEDAEENEKLQVEKQNWVDAVTKVKVNDIELVKAETPANTENGYSISMASVIINSDVFTEERASYTITIEATGYVPLTGTITVRNLGAKTFYLRYLDGDGNVLKSKSYTLEDIKNMSSDEEVIYTALCTMRGITGYKAKGVSLSTLLADAGIPFAEGMHLRTRTNDKNTANDNNDENAYFNTDCSGADRGDIGDEDEPFSYSRFMGRVRYSFTGLYEDLALQEELNTLVKSKKSGERSDEDVLAVVDKATKQVVEPMIAYDYVVQILYSNYSETLPNTSLQGKIGEEVGFRFLFGMAYESDEEGQYLSDEATNHEITRYTFGIDIINPNYKQQSIEVTDSYNKTVGDTAFNLNAKTDGDGTLSYVSSNTKVATVSKTGQVTIKGAGSAKITITASETNNTPSATKSVEIKVAKGKQNVQVSSSYSKKVGDAAFNLNAKTDGDGTLSYVSSNTKVVTVSKAGKVTIKGAGSAKITITASETNNRLSDTKYVSIKVAKASQKIEVAHKSYTKTYGAKAFNLGAKATGNGKLTYTSSDKNVVAVSATGAVTVKAEGKATITINAGATANYTKASVVKISITVNPIKVTLSSVKSIKKGQVDIAWSKDAKATGYQITYSTNKSFSKSTTKTVNVKSAKTLKTTLKGLKSKKICYVKVRAYKSVGSSKLYGAYSVVRSASVK